MRKLATAALAFSAAIFLANYILPQDWLPLCAGVLALGGAVLLLLRRKGLRRAVIVLFAAAVGLGCFFVHALQTTRPARLLDGETREVTGRLLDYPKEYEGYCRATVRITGGDLTRVDAIVYDSGKALAGAEPGEILSFTAKLSAADTRFGERYNAYNARDIYLIASAKGEITRRDGGFSFASIPVRINRALSRLVTRIFPADTAAFIQSLMLGDKTELYREEALHIAMSRAGFMHVVAVSGMHIAFLVGLIQLLFGAGKRSSLLGFSLVWLFVLITGAGPAAVRAGIMQSFLLLAPLLRRENDPVTSLATALGLILLINPCAAGSVSLQLSFAAMAGILCLAEPIHGALTELLPWPRLRGVLATAAASVAVMAFTVPLMALHFGYVAILSPLTNVLGLWAVSLCFCGAYLACGLALLFEPIGIAAAWLVSWLARYLFLVARLVSAIPFAAVYIRGVGSVLWVVFCYAAFLAYGLSKAKTWRKVVYPTAMSALALVILLTATRLSYASGAGVISVLDVGQGQCISVFSGEETLLIDCGGLGTLDNAGETAGAYLISCGRRQVDALVLTHLDSDHVNGVTTLMELLPVELLIVPENAPKDNGYMKKIAASAARHGTELVYLGQDGDLTLGGIRARLIAPEAGSVGNEHGIIAAVSLGDYDMLVTGDISQAAEIALLQRHELRDMELLIVGHHGSKYSSSNELLGSIGADTAIISVGYNSYGHPAQETLERIAAYGYNIYRTDESGTIEIRIG